MKYTIGVDLGGTNLRAASLTETGGLIHQISGTTTLTEGRDRVVGDIVRFIESIRDHQCEQPERPGGNSLADSVWVRSWSHGGFLFG